MTKERLYNELQEGITAKTLDEFFESNVCIPKGANLHPYADVLHEWIEGAKIECRYKANTSFEWKENVTLPSKDYEYRIKPSEPVYEWQWLMKGRTQFDISGYCTELQAGSGWVKIEETKRERK